MYVRWLDEIEDFRFDVAHLPGAWNLTDPLSRSCFTDGDGPAASTGDADAESQQEPFSRLGRDASAQAGLASVRAGWAANRRFAEAVFADARGGHESHPTLPRGGAGLFPPCTGMLFALVCLELSLGTGMMRAPSPPVPSEDFFLSLTFVQSLVAALAIDTLFWPIMRCAATAIGQLVELLGAPTRTPKSGTFLVRCGLLYRRGQGKAQ